MEDQEVSSHFRDLLLRLESQHLLELKLLREENQENHLRAQGIQSNEIEREEDAPIAREDVPIKLPATLASTWSYGLSCGSEILDIHDVGQVLDGDDLGPRKADESANALHVQPVPTDISSVPGTQHHGILLHRFSSTISALDRAFFETDTYELCMGMLILLSVMVLAAEMQLMGYQIGYMMDYPNIRLPPATWGVALETLRWIDRIFTGLFVLDILLRLSFLRCRFFQNRFNVLDFTVISCSVLEELFGDSFPLDAPFLRLLRFAKVARSLRVLKRVHILGSLHLLLKSVHASLEVLFWSLCLLGVIQCIAGMLLAQSLQPFLMDEANEPAVRQAIFRYFGTFTATLLTMFEVLMANWSPPCRILVDNVSELYSFGFIIYRCLVGFAVLNVVSAVFLQQTMKVAAADQEVALQQRQMAAEAYTKKLEAFFKRLDKSGDGVITWTEFSAVLNSPKLQNWLATLELETHDLVNLFQMIDDGDGEISLTDFLHGARQLQGRASSIAVAEVMATARRTEAKADASLVMLANMSGVGLQDLKKRTRRLKSSSAFAGRDPVESRGLVGLRPKI